MNSSVTKKCFKSQRPEVIKGFDCSKIMFTLPTNLRDVHLASFFSALFLLLVGSGPKRSVPIEKLGSSSLVSSIFQREENCTAA